MENFEEFKSWLQNQQEYKDCLKDEPLIIFLGGSRGNQFETEDSDYDIICVADDNSWDYKNVVLSNMFYDKYVHIMFLSKQRLIDIFINDYHRENLRLYTFFMCLFTKYVIYETKKGQEFREFVTSNSKYFYEHGLYLLCSSNIISFNPILNSKTPIYIGKQLAHILCAYSNVKDLNLNELVIKVKRKQSITLIEWEQIQNIISELKKFYEHFNPNRMMSLKIIMMGMI